MCSGKYWLIDKMKGPKGTGSGTGKRALRAARSSEPCAAVQAMHTAATCSLIPGHTRLIKHKIQAKQSTQVASAGIMTHFPHRAGVARHIDTV
jgi:hypothetical protein